MNEPTRNVQHISGRERRQFHRRTKFLCVDLDFAILQWQLLDGRKHPPGFCAFQLENEDVVGVEMGGKSLRAGRCAIEVGADRAPQLRLQALAKLGNGRPFPLQAIGDDRETVRPGPVQGSETDRPGRARNGALLRPGAYGSGGPEKTRIGARTFESNQGLEVGKADEMSESSRLVKKAGRLVPDVPQEPRRGRGPDQRRKRARIRGVSRARTFR